MAGAEPLPGRRAVAPFRLGPHEVDPGLDRIVGPHGTQAIEPRVMDLLVFLAAHAGETVSKERLLEEVWQGAAVVEGVLPKAISALRQALGDDAAAPAFILTVPRRGYRLVASVEPLPARASDLASAPAEGAAKPGGQRPMRSGFPRSALLALLVSAAIAVVLWAPRGREGQVAGARPGGESSVLTPRVETLLLEARLLWSRRGSDAVRRANELLLEAAKEAPGSAEVHGWLALSFVTRGNYLGEVDSTTPRAATEVATALRLDPESAIAHCAAGALAINRDLDAAAAERHLRLAVELDPDLLAARQYLAEALSILERNDEALATIEQAIRVEPLSPVLQGVRGLVLQRADRPLAALEAYDRVLALEPKFVWVHRNRAWALHRLGRAAEAGEAFYLEAKGVGEAPEHLATLRAALDESGLAGFWRWRLDRLEAVRASGIRLRPMTYAEALAGVGRVDEALAEIARAAHANDGEYYFYFRDSLAFAPLRDDPRFRALYRTPPPEG